MDGSEIITARGNQAMVWEGGGKDNFICFKVNPGVVGVNRKLKQRRRQQEQRSQKTMI